MSVLKFLSVLTLLYFLVACQSNDGYEVDLNETEAIRIEHVPLDLEVVPYLTTDGQTVLLIDLVTGDILSSYELENEELWVAQAFDFENGYFGAFVGVSSPHHLALRSLLHFDDVNRSEDHDYQYEFLIFDEELNIIESITIDPESTFGTFVNFYNMQDIATFENGEVIVYFSPHRDFLEHEYAKIFSYNLHTEELITFETDIHTIDRMMKIDDERIFLVGVEGTEMIHGMMRYTLLYGIFDLNSGGMISRDLREGFHWREIIMSESYVLMTEQDRRELANTELNHVILIYDLLTMESELFSLGEGDSLWARFSKNQAYITTVSDDRSYFRKYEFSSGDLIYEIPIDPILEYAIFGHPAVGYMMFDFFPTIIPIEDSIYGIYLYNRLGFSRFHQTVVTP